MPNPYISLLRISWQFARGEKGRYLACYLLFLITNFVTALKPLLIGWFLNALQQKGVMALDYMWPYIGGYLGLYLLQWSFHGPGRYLERTLAFNIGRNFLEEHFRQVMHLPIGWHKGHHSGSTISRLRKASIALRDFFQNGSFYFQTLAQFVLSLAAMIYFLPLFGSIAALFGLVTIWIIFLFDKPYIRSLDEVNEGEHHLSSTLADSLSNILTVITFRAERQMQAELGERITKIFSPFRRNAVIGERKWFIAGLLISSIYCMMIIGYIYANYEPGKSFHIGTLVMLINYVTQFTNVFFNIAFQYNQIVQYHTDLQSAREIPEAYSRVEPPKKAESLPASWQHMEISRLSFSYRHGDPEQEPHGKAPEKSGHCLQDLHLHFRRGKRIALIGASGCGKSTLMALLRGLYTPCPGGRLTVDHRQYPWGSLAGDVTLFPQQPEIFNHTIRYNITLGLPYTDEEVRNACKIAGFLEVVEALPDGVETAIEENGVNLSGGQKQRLALARGVLAARNSSIVLLDEPTSNVDQQTESGIYRSLFEAFRDKVIVSSLHRLHLLERFDHIYIFHEGRIVRDGRYEEMNRDPRLTIIQNDPQKTGGYNGGRSY
jgi:ATP-binding cassette, subfamily B, bacterial